MSIEERLADLRALALEHMPGDVSRVYADVASIICNGCGLTVTALTLDLPRLLDGWSLGEHGAGRDFCPNCAPNNE